MTEEWPVPVEGGCGCQRLRYRLGRAPLFIHCCNCHQCQRETGSAFVLNAMVEANEVKLIPGTKVSSAEESNGITQPKLVLNPSESGKGQLIARCPHCFVAVWSFYPGAGPNVKFIRAGTLDKQSLDGRNVESLLHPDVFIFTKFKQPWVEYPIGDEIDGKVVEEFYDPQTTWPEEVQERFGRMRPMTQEWKDRGGRWEELGDIVDCR